MTADFALSLSRETLLTAIWIGGPVLGMSMLVGLAISILQVVTQIQEMSLTFVPKIIAVAVTIIAFGGWMLSELIAFSTMMIGDIPRHM